MCTNSPTSLIVQTVDPTNLSSRVLYHWKHLSYWELSEPSFIQENTPRWMPPFKTDSRRQSQTVSESFVSRVTCGGVEAASMYKIPLPSFPLCIMLQIPRYLSVT